MLSGIIGTASTAIRNDGSNIGIGTDAQFADAGSVNNIAIGADALDSTTDDAIGNVAIGRNALTGITTGISNTAVGYNVGIGLSAHPNSYNTILGNQTLSNASAQITGATAIGYQAMTGDLTTGANYTVAIGYEALNALTSGSNSIAIGYQAGKYITTSLRNTAIGYASVSAAAAGNDNTCVGYQSGAAMNASATGNTLMGKDAGVSILDGLKNSFFGSDCGDATDDGSYNVAMGYRALSANCGNENTALGFQAGIVATGTAGTYVGAQAGELIEGSTGNTAVGYQALGNAIADSYNVGVGYQAGAAITGGNNVCIGTQAGDSITSGGQNVAIGRGSDCVADAANQVAIGDSVVTNAASQVRIGNSSYYVSLDASQASQNFVATSDVRIKKDIENTDLGLNFIKLLRPVKYREKPTSEFPKEFKVKDPSDKTVDIIHDGLIAQEVKEAADSLNSTFSGWSEDADTRQMLDYGKIVMPLIKAVQELAQQIEDLKKG